MCEALQEKKCFKCGETKPLSSFYKHKAMLDGYLNKCKECTKKDVLENREKREDYYHAYDRVRNRQPRRKQSKKVYQSREDVKERSREVKRRSSEKHWKKKEANTVLGNAVRDGKVIKQPCFVCGDTDVQGHHPDYDSPLDVVWLCVPHHAEIHRKYDEEYNLLLLQQPKGNRWDVVKKQDTE